LLQKGLGGDGAGGGVLVLGWLTERKPGPGVGRKGLTWGVVFGVPLQVRRKKARTSKG